MNRIFFLRVQANPIPNPELSTILKEDIMMPASRPTDMYAIPMPDGVLSVFNSTKSPAEIRAIINQKLPGNTLTLKIELLNASVQQPLTTDELLDIISAKGGRENLNEFEQSEFTRLFASN